MPSKKAPKADATPSFEQALNELETLVGELEAGELSLDDSLQKFERGVTLARQCQQSLNDAEQKIQTLSDSGDKDAE